MTVHAILVAFELYESTGGGFVQKEFIQAVKEAIPIIRDSEAYKAERDELNRRAMEVLNKSYLEDEDDATRKP